MHLSKSKILPIAGIFTLIAFIALSYFNGQIFMDRILVCAFILLLVFMLKMGSDPGQSPSNSNNGNL